ncbi:LacI family DNA-binding transcriptional regulator [Paenibacillus caui]|uniref:LacI family DNA-binding transcriptional regulator n=1 Tax=Paenibacillus caui TaxID=2873927 RepID=UPI001CA8C4D7|nr:LacI family DNA-binding transcriptional regulator [Paenibacillus caui]
MATIKEIASKAGVSPGTASFVLSGKGDLMRISKSTQNKILEIAHSVGYSPNLSARRLRSKGELLPVIAILWTLDSRASLISPFLQGIQSQLSGDLERFELLIQPYENSRLDKVDSLLTGMRYNGAIIANASDEDLDFLDNSEVKVPLVIYQRKSEKYSCVYVDSYGVGKQVAELFADKGHSHVGMIVPDSPSQAIYLRFNGFKDAAWERGLYLPDRSIVYGCFSEEGGYKAVKEMALTGRLPAAMFFLSETMAIGGLAALHELGVRIPQDIEIVGHDNHDQTRFTIPSLTTVNLPVAAMANSCVDIVMDMIEHKVKEPVAIVHETSLVYRDSCGSCLKP